MANQAKLSRLFPLTPALINGSIKEIQGYSVNTISYPLYNLTLQRFLMLLVEAGWTVEPPKR